MDSPEVEMGRQIDIEEYSPTWPKRFEQLRARIWPAVSHVAVAMEHVGSTAVEGLAAKPIVDADIIIASPRDFPEIRNLLRGLGYTHKGDLGIEGREAFDCCDLEFAHHLYVCIEGCAALRNHLILRDHLRSHPDDRREYAKLKRALARQCGGDIEAYVEGKSEFITAIVDHYDDEP